MSISTTEIENKLDRILPTVVKPGRYVGGELNQVIKAWAQVSTHVALIFPDIYDIGIPNLGVAILYDELNARDDVLAERAYSPWVDMEAAMRATHLPLYSLETKHPLVDFDIIGFTLPYETLYTNALNILDLAGIPLFSCERNDNEPLVIAGGHAAFNPEPMAPFIDAFVIGEGEEVIHEVVNTYQSWKSRSLPKHDLLISLSAISGVYVPSLYEVEYKEDGCIASFYPKIADVPSIIEKRILPTLPPPLTHFLVPNIDVVHNRIPVEIMRGCTRGCRFCQAGMIQRPIRERPIAEIIEAIKIAVQATGYEEVALLSLSSSDYTHIIELVDAAIQAFSNEHISISLPSLRIESFSVELMDKMKQVRPSGGFTLAPEAASEHMRQIINKPVTNEQLLETARAVFQHGWTSLKLYFMIGHPQETLDDVQSIIDLCNSVLSIGKSCIGHKAKLHVGVSTFVPKSHTPFQWTPCDTIEQITAKQSLLKHGLRSPNIKLTWNDPNSTMLESWLSRGDRRLSQIILRAWQKGAKFDAWQDQYRYGYWLEAFAESGLDPDFYSHRQRSLEEILPWDHISTGVSKAHLIKEYSLSQQGLTREDCRTQCYGCGLVSLLSDYPAADFDLAIHCPINR